MNDYVSRSEISPVERGGAASPVVAVQSLPARNAAVDQSTVAVAAKGPAVEANPDQEVAGAAEYANVHAQIAVIMADMRQATDAASAVSGAESDIQSMLPTAVVIVPLPPASKEAVEHATNVAKRLVQQAYYAHSAQANVKRGTVDQVLAAGA